MDKDKPKGKKLSKSKKKPAIIKLADYRKNKNEERRREYERILFNRILGVYSFAEKEGLHHIEVVDMSFSGLKFVEERPENVFKKGDKIALRFYFTPSSFLRLVLTISRINPYDENGRNGLEYGCSFDKGTKSYKVIHQLVSFMQVYSEVACRDHNPPMIFF